MATSDIKPMGQLLSVHAVSPAQLQRAFFITVTSFLFFLAMMFAFYLRQNILYFLLATAFLLVYLFTMFSLMLLRRNVLRIHELGFVYKKVRARWDEVESVADDGKIALTKSRSVAIPQSFTDFENVMADLRRRSAASAR
jgi:K+ transporter